MSIALWAALAVAIDAALIAAAVYFIGHAGENAEPDDLMAIADAVQQEPARDWDAAMVAELLGGNA